MTKGVKIFVMVGSTVAVVAVIYLACVRKAQSVANIAAPIKGGTTAHDNTPPTNTATTTTTSSTSNTSSEFDKYIAQAQSYANRQTWLIKQGLNGAISLAKSNKQGIINEAMTTGQPLFDLLNKYFPNIISK